ncbi:MAG: UDP-N-acetylmuramoyl-tripeptide--D-alanyl-D-alanine ligase [Patescibacteria group bacterium]|nr:UDP-N-acetylmuramoyl-tripeptide--D-alanyl-D-alanine ligase [Patescibacteria group bacterium]
MKHFLTNLLRGTLRNLSRLTIWRYGPRVIGITGSVGKTSTKLAIAAVLAKENRVRFSRGNLNSELGVALTILGTWSERELDLVSRNTANGTKRIRKTFFWIKVLLSSAWRVIFKTSSYPEILILEYGADRPGDIKYLLKFARPTIAVITAVGEIPVHVEFYAGPEEVAREKGRLIEALNSTGFAVLNHDDATVTNLKDRTRARVSTYGFAPGADLRIVRFENRVEQGRPAGISFKLENAGSLVPVRIDGVLGHVHAYAAGAAASVGLIFGMNLVKISEALESYAPASSRTELVPGVKRTLVIDDAYNASPLSMHAALDALRDLPAKRKVAVLGDMLEIGKYAIEAHEAMGRLAAASADVLVAVGPRAKFIAEAAREAGMKKSVVFSFDTADEAKKPVEQLIKEGDLVLVKGSHAIQLDKVVEEIRDQHFATSTV